MGIGILVPPEVTVRPTRRGLQLIVSPSGWHDPILYRFARRLQRDGWTIKPTGQGWRKLAYPPEGVS